MYTESFTPANLKERKKETNQKNPFSDTVWKGKGTSEALVLHQDFSF